MTIFAKSSLIGRLLPKLLAKSPDAAIFQGKSDQLFKAMFEQAAVGVAVVSTKPVQILQINQCYCDILGYSINELLGKSLLDFTHPDDIERDVAAQEDIQEIIESVYAGQKRYIKKDGSVVWVNLAVTPIGDTNNIDDDPIHIVTVQDITNQKKAENSLKESEATARALLEAPTDSIFLTDKDGIIHNLNKTAAERLGRNEHELIGKCGYDYMPPDLAEYRKRKTDEVFKTGKTQRFEDRRGDMWFDSVIYPIIDGKGLIGKAAIIARDITQRKQADRALEISEKKFRTIFEQAAVGVAVVESKSGRFLQINQRYCDILGYTVGEMLQKTVVDITYPKDLEEDFAIWWKQEGKKDSLFARQKRYIKKDGSPVWVKISVSALWDYEDQSDERVYITVVEDINEQKKAEEEVKESNARYDGLFERSSDAVIVHDLGGRFLDANPAALKLLGHDKAQLMGTPIGRLMHREEVPAATEALNEIIETGFMKEPFIYQLINKNKENIWVESTASLLYKDGVPYGIQEVARNITMRKQHEAELLKAKQVADQANQAKSEFLANISHELRTPMQAVLGFSKLGLDRLESINKEKTKQYFAEIHTSGQRLLNMLNNLLDLSRLEAGMVAYRFRRRKLSNVLLDVLDELDPLIKEKKVVIKFENLDAPDFASFDKEKIMQVIRNLLANAIKFSTPGASITTVVLPNNGSIVVSVKDRGPGIPENELESIFDKFVQSSKTKTGAGGTGLGLAICHEIIKAHGGNIWAENNTGDGATFSFTLPVSQTR